MTIDTGPKCPKCGATVYALVEHYCKIDPDSIDAPIVVAVCERLPAAGWLPPADAARLRSLLRELVEDDMAGLDIEHLQHDYPIAATCRYCYESVELDGDAGASRFLDHAADCPVARARAEVGGDE